MMTKRCFIILLCIVASTSCLNSSHNVVGAETTLAQAGEHANSDSIDAVPQSVALIWGGEVFCSGVILDKRTILTAAHCLGRYPDREIGIYFGQLQVSQARPLQAAILVASFEIHPNFYRDQNQTKNDFAKLYFDTDLPIAKSLLLPQLDPYAGLASVATCGLVYAAGYGIGIGDQKPSKRLFKGQILKEDNQAVFVKPIGDQFSCPGHSGCPVFLQAKAGKPPVLLGINIGDVRCLDDGKQISVFMPIYPQMNWLRQRPFAPIAVGQTLPTQIRSPVLTSGDPTDTSLSPTSTSPPTEDGNSRPFSKRISRPTGCRVRGPIFSKPKVTPNESIQTKVK